VAGTTATITIMAETTATVTITATGKPHFALL
jgi:hypothetical protein